MRMPLTVWAWFITPSLGRLAFGVLLSAGILLLRIAISGTSFYVPLVVVNGQIMDIRRLTAALATPLLVLGHPEVYIASCRMGVASQLLSTFSRKPISDQGDGPRHHGIGFSASCLGHHMFMTHESVFGLCLFHHDHGHRVPSAIKTFKLAGDDRGGRVRFQTPMLYAVGFVSFSSRCGLMALFWRSRCWTFSA